MPRDRPRVVVTGIGVVSPLGALPAFWERACAGETGIAPRPRDDPAADGPRLAARVRDWDPRASLPAALLRRMDRLSRMVVTASRSALADAGLALDAAAATTTGLVVGTAFGNLAESWDFVRGLFAKGPARANPFTFPNLVLNAPAGYAAIDLALHGPSFTVTRGEASGEGALALAYDTIAAGHADVVLAGGGDEVASVLFEIYRDLGVLSPQDRAASGDGAAREWSSPFDTDRNGFVMGEGVAMMVLERAEHAAARGAPARAELVGYATYTAPSSPYDWPRPTPAATAEAARQLAALGWQPPGTRLDGATRADLVLSCANSTHGLDAYECAHLASLLGEAVRQVVVTSLKGAIGEFGAAGALAAAAAVLALRTGRAPRLGALVQPARGCTLRLAGPDAPDPEGGFAHALVSAAPRGGACLTLLFREA